MRDVQIVRAVNAKDIVFLFAICAGCDAQYSAGSLSPKTSRFSSNSEAETIGIVQVHEDTLDWDEADSIAFGWWEDEWYTPIDSQTVPLVLLPTLTYDNWKNHLIRRRDSLKTRYELAGSDSGRMAVLKEAEKCLLNNLVNGIIPHWYGTPWEFNGHTDVPGEGEIACGYFVSTTLLHAGFNLNRYKLAQQSAYNEIKTLQTTGSVHKLINKDVDELVELAQSSLKEGLYVIGLDFHVGYLLKWKEEVYFVHSNYWYPSQVIVEYAKTSVALMGSASYYIGEVTTNKALLKKWIFNTRISIVMD